MFDSRVLAVDPGLSRCGVAVIDGPASRAAAVLADVIRTPADMRHGERLRAIHTAIAEAISEHQPRALAVERVFINAQARTGVGAMQVVGLVHLLGAHHRIGVTEYTPSQVKAAVTGVGDADKEQVTFMVQRMLRLTEPPRPADKADALAVGLCHLQQAGHLGAVAASLSDGLAKRVAADADGISPRLAAAIARAGPGLTAMRPARQAPSPPHSDQGDRS